MAESLLDSLPGILFATDQTNKLNEYVKDNIDDSLFIFFHYTPDIIKPYSYDGKYLTGVSNLYKLIKDSGWVLEKSNEILDDSSVKELKKYIDIIHLLREVQHHSVRADNKLKLQAAEKWWSNVGVKSQSQRPESTEDYQKALDGLEKLGLSLMKESENFVKNVSKLNETQKKAAIKTWTEVIIQRYVTERNLFICAIDIYQKYSQKNERKKSNDIIISYFTNEYYCLISAQKNNIQLYSLPKYRKLVDNYVEKKLKLFRDNYNLDFEKIEDLIDDIKNDHKKYIDIFFDNILSGLIKDALNQEKTLEIDSIVKVILEKDTTAELISDEGKSIKIENVRYFNLNV